MNFLKTDIIHILFNNLGMKRLSNKKKLNLSYQSLTNKVLLFVNSKRYRRISIHNIKQNIRDQLKTIKIYPQGIIDYVMIL